MIEHGRALYEELVRVPLIVKYPSWDKRKGALKPLIEESQQLSTLTTPELDKELEARLRALGYIK